MRFKLGRARVLVRPGPHPRRTATRLRPSVEGIERRILPATFLVTREFSGGPGSLYDAITQSNNTPGPDIIDYAENVMGSTVEGFGLPSITDSVTISPSHTVYVGGVNLTGHATGGIAFDIKASNCVLENLVLIGFTEAIRLNPGTKNARISKNYIGTSQFLEQGANTMTHGIRLLGSSDNVLESNAIGNCLEESILLQLPSASFNTIKNNQIGIGRDGFHSFKNLSDGIRISNGAHHNSVVGNIIARNGRNGIAIDDTGGKPSHDNTITGNLMGAIGNVFGIGNKGSGISIVNSYGNVIGGVDRLSGNTLSANSEEGVSIGGEMATDNVTQGNWIGTDRDGIEHIANEGNGVKIWGGAKRNIVGGRTVGSANVIANNGRSGIALEGDQTSGNSIIGNSIFRNQVLCIDLQSDGVTTNDDTDLDSGPNELLNFPVLREAIRGEDGSTLIRGVYDGRPNATVTVDFYASRFLNVLPNGKLVGQGEAYLGSVRVSGDKLGHGTIEAKFKISDTEYKFITATATDSAGNTSELSTGITVSINGAAPRPPSDGLVQDFKPVTDPEEVKLSRRPGGTRNTAYSLGKIAESIIINENINTVNTIQLYKVSLDKGQIVTFDIDAISDLDAFIKIFGDTGPRLSFNDKNQSEEPIERNSPVGTDPFIRFVAPKAGTYYVAVSNARYATQPYSPDTDTGRTLKPTGNSRETGGYSLIIRTPNIHAEGSVKIESLPQNREKVRITFSFVIQDADINPGFYFAIQPAGSTGRRLRMARIDTPQKSTDKPLLTNIVGNHTVSMEVDLSWFDGNTIKFLILDPVYETNARGDTLETDETDNSYTINVTTDRFSVEDIPTIEDKIGFVNGARLLRRWFTGSASTAPKYVLPDELVDMKFVLEYMRSRIALTLLKATYVGSFMSPITPEQIQLRTALIKRAKRLLDNSNRVSVQLTEFKAATTESSGIIRANQRFHDTQKLGAEKVSLLMDPRGDDLLAALGNFSLYSAPIGSVTRQGKFATVTVTGLGVYVRDTFDFNGSQRFGFGLGNWKLPDGFSTVPLLGYEFVDNARFRAFRMLTGRGSDFLVFSDIRIENFETPMKFTFAYR